MNIISGIILTIISFNALASGLVTSSETKNLCENAASLLSKGKISESFNSLKPYWPIPAAEIDNLSYQTETQLKMVSKRFGKPIGTDFIKTQKAGDSFIKHTFILKHEKTSIRYICVFYKPKTKWLVNSVSWDDKTALLFE